MQIYIAKDGQETGPFSEDQLQPLLDAGTVSLNDLAWYEGLAEWTPLHQIFAPNPPAPEPEPPPIPVVRAPQPRAAVPMRPVPVRGVPARAAGPVRAQARAAHVPGPRPGVAPARVPASFGLRLAAYFMDAVVVALLAKIASWPASLFIGSMSFPTIHLSPAEANDPRVMQALVASLVPVIMRAMFFQMAVAWLYHALMESSAKQATIGKLGCGLIVTNLQGQRIGFGQASGRFFGIYLSWAMLGIGFLMCLWTEKKQCLHDLMAGCLVSKKSPHGQPSSNAPQTAYERATTRPVSSSIKQGLIVGLIVAVLVMGGVGFFVVSPAVEKARAVAQRNAHASRVRQTSGSASHRPAAQPQPRAADRPAPPPNPPQALPALPRIATPGDATGLVKLPMLGSGSGAPYESIDPQGGVLVGLDVSYRSAFGGDLIESIQPIFRRGENDLVTGVRAGGTGGHLQRITAKPGYAVGGVRGRVGMMINGFKIVFMRLNGDRLDVNDAYESPWLGFDQGGGPFELSSDGKPIRGLYGVTQNEWTGAFGFIVKP